jgi:hypothetical protein
VGVSRQTDFGERDPHPAPLAPTSPFQGEVKKGDAHWSLLPAKCCPLPQPKSGAPDFGHTMERPKSETSGFGWEMAQIWAPSFLTQ